MIRITAATLALIAVLMAMCAYGANVSGSNAIVIWGNNSLAKALIESKGPIWSLLPEGKLNNLVDVSLSLNTLALVGGDQSHNPFDGLSLFTYNLKSGDLSFVKQDKGLLQASISPKGDVAALIVCGANGCELQILNLTSGHIDTLISGVIQRFGGVSWNSTGSMLAYTTNENQIKVRDLLSGKDVLTLSGSQPAWSPSSNALAYIRDKTVLIYDIGTSSERTLVKRHFWQSTFQGSIFWSADGSKISTNVTSGFAGYEFKCLIADAVTGDYQTYDLGSNRCGPWL